MTFSRLRKKIEMIKSQSHWLIFHGLNKHVAKLVTSEAGKYFPPLGGTTSHMAMDGDVINIFLLMEGQRLTGNNNRFYHVK